MKLQTEYFGEYEYQEKDILTFPEGLYGFEHAKQFVLITSPDENFPFYWLQSIQDEELYFVVTSPFIFVEDYDIEIEDTIIEGLGIEKHEDVMVFSLAVIPKNAADTTINLKAPLIINYDKKMGKQTILNDDYAYKHKLFKSPEGRA